MQKQIKYSKRYSFFRGLLIFWTLFIGIGALWGSSSMLIDPSGKLLQMDSMLPYFQALPFADVLFQDYVFSGIALLIVNGITNLTAAVLLFLHKKIGEILGCAFGFTLMLWITIQFIIFPMNVLSTAYFIFGVLQCACGIVCLIGRAQSEFVAKLQAQINLDSTISVSAAETSETHTQKTRLVVYFSRRGYVKSLAMQLAASKNAETFELKTNERTQGDAGFWWCGRSAMLKKPMKILSMPDHLNSYEEIYVFYPVWVFGICSPVQDFLLKANGVIRQKQKIHYVAVHFMNAKLKNLAKKADDLLGVQHASFSSVRCRFGKFRELGNF